MANLEFKNEQEVDRARKKLIVEIVFSTIRANFENGLITESDLDNPDSHIKILKSMIPKGGEPMIAITDHRESLLKHAELQLKEGHYENALVFYAMYFEHEVNHLLEITMQRKKIKLESRKEALRLRLNDKLTWLMDLLEVRRPKKDFIRALEPLSKERNDYVHYKWIGIDINLDRKAKEVAGSMSTQVAYMKNYSSWVIYRGRKSVIIQKIKRISHKPLTTSKKPQPRI